MKTHFFVGEAEMWFALPPQSSWLPRLMHVHVLGVSLAFRCVLRVPTTSFKHTDELAVMNCKKLCLCVYVCVCLCVCMCVCTHVLGALQLLITSKLIS